jgi:hypothetical protein
LLVVFAVTALLLAASAVVVPVVGVVVLVVLSLVVVVELWALRLLSTLVCDVVVVGLQLGVLVVVASVALSLVIVVESGALRLLLALVCEVGVVGPELGALEVATQVVVETATVACLSFIRKTTFCQRVSQAKQIFPKVGGSWLFVITVAAVAAAAFFVAGVAVAVAVIGLLVSLHGHSLRVAEVATHGLRGATACQEAGGGRLDTLVWGNGGVACFEGPLCPVLQ